MLFVLNEGAVCCACDRAARDSEFVVLHLRAELRASAPCVCLTAVRRSECRVMVLVLEALHDNVGIGVHGMVVRVDDVLVVPLEPPRRADGIVGVGRSLHEADAARLVNGVKDFLFVGACGKATVVLGIHLDARPVKARCVRDREEGIRRRVRRHGVLEVDLDLAKVVDALRRDALRVDVQRVVRYDIARGCAAAAIEGDVAECGRSKYTRIRSEVDRVPRRLACAVRIAAVDFGAAAECSVFDVDGVALGIARRDVVRRRECRIRGDVAAVELAARIHRAAGDVDRVVLRIGVLRGVDQRRICLARRIHKQMHALRVACIAVRHRTACVEVQRVVIRSAIECLGVARTHVRVADRHMRRCLLNVQRVVICCVAILGIARMDVYTAHRRCFRCVLETVAVERNLRYCNRSRTGCIGKFAELVVTDIVKECGGIVLEGESAACCQSQCRSIDVIVRQMLYPCVQTVYGDVFPLKIIGSGTKICRNHGISRIDTRTQDKIHLLKVVKSLDI